MSTSIPFGNIPSDGVFPGTAYFQHQCEPHPEFLRDLFAMAAMQNLCSVLLKSASQRDEGMMVTEHLFYRDCEGGVAKDPAEANELAELAYEIADAMMEAREK